MRSSSARPSTQHADVVFPAESYAEKEGTVTHPDGRLQRLRPAIGHPGEVRMEWQVLLDLARQRSASTCGAPLTAGRGARRARRRRCRCIAGITLDEIGGRGVRWQERDARRERRARQAFGDARLRRRRPTRPRR